LGECFLDWLVELNWNDEILLLKFTFGFGTMAHADYETKMFNYDIKLVKGILNGIMIIKENFNQH
jgi:hypothetical protein